MFLSKPASGPPRIVQRGVMKSLFPWRRAVVLHVGGLAHTFQVMTSMAPLTETSDAPQRAVRRRRAPTSPCADCGRCTDKLGEFYMVRDDVWLAAGMTPDGGLLCIGCLEDRLGRSLCADDFTDAPCNDVTDAYIQLLIERGQFSLRLVDRLTTPGQPKPPRRARVSRRWQPPDPNEGIPPAFIGDLPVIDVSDAPKQNRRGVDNTAAIPGVGHDRGPASG